MSETVTKKKSKSWPKIGVVIKGDYGSYIKLEKNVEILVDGVKIPMNEKRNVRLENPRTKVEQLFERGIITEAEKDKRLESLAVNSWLSYELVVAPPKSE